MASTLGVRPDSLVFGASAGKVDWSSTATTCLPAPIANSVSVLLADSDTIRSGRVFRTICLAPSGFSSTGNCAAAGPLDVGVVVAACSRFAQPARTSAAATGRTTARRRARLGMDGDNMHLN